MTTDKELLELAAKAAGVNAYWSTDGTIQNRPKFVATAGGGMGTMPHECPWNPLADDGDALRLAVKLGINIDYVIEFIDDEWIISGATVNDHEFEEVNEKDTCSATRRAIVRAAAEIWRSM